MSKIETLKRLLKSKEDIIGPLGDNGLLNWLSDSAYIRLLFKSKMGYKLNLKNPVTFNEKLQWLKLNDRSPIYVDLVDKLTVKNIISNKFGEEYVVPTYAIWDKAEDISFDSLPNQFVLKCNHDQGSVMIIKDKNEIDIDYIRNRYKKLLKRSPFPGTREYPYKCITPKVFAEKLLTEEIIDYKFYCFNGEPRFLYCGKGLTEDHSLAIDFYDMEWNQMPFYRTDYKRLGMIDKPKNFELMKNIARNLSEGVSFVRIDLFEVDNQVYFSEFTLCPASGFMPFEPKEHDTIVGGWLKIK